MFENDNFFLTNWPDSYLEERLEASRVWSTLENGFEIHELNSDRMDDVVNIIKENYLAEEPLMVGSRISSDTESIEQYLYLVRYWMMDTLSTVAIEQETGNVVGFILCRVTELNNEDIEFREFRIYKGEIWKELVKFKQHVMGKGNPYEYFNVDKILEINLWFVLPSYRRKGIGSELLRNVMLRQLPEYGWFNIEVIAGMFTSLTSQRVAESLGLETLYNHLYEAWTIKNKETGKAQIFFEDRVPGNDSAKVMAIKVDIGSRSGDSA